jgi:uncharacterized protein YbaA (DUF1428 family)
MVMSNSNSVEERVVQHVLYRVPKKNHDAMLQLCKEAEGIIKESGVLRHELYQLNNADVPGEGFTNIASTVSAKVDEEVWIESIYYRDRQHMVEVIAKMTNDERCEQSYKQSLELLPSGAKFITGSFDRLIV